MRRNNLVLISFIVLSWKVSAEPRVIQEIWEAAHLGKAKVGFVHTQVQLHTQGRDKLYRTTQELNFRIKRFGKESQLRMVSGTVETEKGTVVGVLMRMFGGPGTQIDGKVEGNSLNLEITQRGTPKISKKVPWRGKAIGLYAQERFFQNKTLKSGDTYSFKTYEPSISRMIDMTVKVGGLETVDIFGTLGKLRKVELIAEPFKYVDQQKNQRVMKLPPVTLWVNKKGIVEQRSTEIPGLGAVHFTRTTKATAMKPGVGTSQLTDLGLQSMIRVDKRLYKPHSKNKIVYRITVKGDSDAKTALASDSRQTITNANGESFDLTVQAIREPKGDGEKKAPKEYLANCYFLNCDDARIQRYAKEAIGSATDPWEKAKRIERWVYRYMRTDNSVPFNTAGQVARQLRGDCRQHAMLAAAMCRAAGVPSKTAVGLVYVQPRYGKPLFGFHMWIEVWIKGQWLALDGTRGEGGIGAAHIKVADHSWYDTQSLTPMLPVARVLGKLDIKIVEAK